MENNKNNNKNKKLRDIISYVLISIICGVSLFFYFNTFWGASTLEEVSYVEFLEAVENDEVVQIDFERGVSYFFYYKEAVDVDEMAKEESEDGSVTGRIPDKSVVYKTANPLYNDFKKDMLEQGIDVQEVVLEHNYGAIIFDLLFQMVLFGGMFGMLMIVMNRMTGGNSKINIETESTKTFADVAGLAEVKESSMIIVDMLKNPDKYKKAGARISKGVLLSGPPGTGKTLLAKAIAGEAGINFMACSAADFENKYVGVGADHVRELFQTAKKNAPCILFIDEIDAVGCKRGADSKSFERQTINQLLSCMDGFSSEDGITVFAATNDVDALDPALLRPGRFDSRFTVGLPDTAEDRKAIAKLYLKNKKLAEDVDLDIFAKETLGCSPADIEVIINEAAIESVKNNCIITRDNIDEAFYKHIMHGHKKKSSDRDIEEIKTTAWHEAGHALIGWLLGEEITKISIVPTTSGAGGVTIFNQKKLGMYTKRELENKIQMMYAGRNAELILNGPDGITNGASQDIKEATNIIANMVTRFGMSQFGMLDLTTLQIPQKDLVQEYQKISEHMNHLSLAMLQEHRDRLEELANLLIQEETMDANRLQALFDSWGDDNA